MSPQLEVVLEISAYGTVILFAALAGLIGLMYLLTAQRLFRPAPEPPAETGAGATGDTERERQLRAVALAVAVAVAVARAATERASLLTTAAAEWRHLHHTRRLSQPGTRARGRS